MLGRVFARIGQRNALDSATAGASFTLPPTLRSDASLPLVALTSPASSYLGWQNPSLADARHC